MKKTILAILMVLSSGIAFQVMAAEGNGQQIMIENQYRGIIEFQFVRDGQTLSSCRAYEMSMCGAEADILSGHQNQIVALDNRGPISAVEVSEGHLRVVLTGNGQLIILGR